MYLGPPKVSCNSQLQVEHLWNKVKMIWVRFKYQYLRVFLLCSSLLLGCIGFFPGVCSRRNKQKRHTSVYVTEVMNKSCGSKTYFH